MSRRWVRSWTETLVYSLQYEVERKIKATTKMTDSIFNSYPPEISEEQQDYLVQTVKDWSIQNGLTVRPNPTFVGPEVNKTLVLATNAPVTLFPSPFPKACFEQAKSLQQVYNELYAAIADDEDWLEETIQE